ncbi:MAG: hypothetical protein KGL16_08380, partial [Acidobacteriota bacterium]|nr:hypothetical protein [Acidobacteriota bacterium]
MPQGGHGRIRAGLVAGTLLAAGLLALPTMAQADTTVGFDNLATGTTVTNQYAAEGIQFGSAADFGRPSPGGGDCGSPSVGSRVIVAYSPPNYAQLNSCAPPGAVAEYFAGTYAAL